MRHTRSHTANRRSHHALIAPRLSICKNCAKAHLKHRVCENCGKYQTHEVIDKAAELERAERRRKEKSKALGIEPEKEKDIQKDE